MKTRFKSISAIFLIIFILSTLSFSSLAVPVNSTLQQKAEVLNTMNILTGFNGDYLLNNKLTRAEAATFAVRVLGQQLHVIVNSKSYSTTTFPDVDPNEWYAPYVGYCVKQGILNGDPSGNYKPNDYITEKSFIKIMLSTLGYEINIDYTWENIYKKAYEVGLVTDLLYIAKVEDNTNFLRSDAVNNIYRALTIKEKATGKELFYKLIDANMITEKDAIKMGFITEDVEDIEDIEDVDKDEVITEIESIIVFDQQNISMQFNEEIVDFGDIFIYEAVNEDKELRFDIEDYDDYYIMLKTERNRPGIEYTIEIRDLEDKDGNVIEVLYCAFIGSKPEKIESNFFRIQKIDPVNKKSAKVYFTHPVNINSENSIYYTVYEDGYEFAEGSREQLIARNVVSEDNCILLTLMTGTFEEDEEYTVKINGDMISAYGVKLNDGDYDEMSFTAVAGEADTFKLVEVIAYDRETLLLNFNKEVNPFLAQQIYNFYVTDADNNPIKINKVTVESQGPNTGEVIFINIDGRFVKEDKYYITINNLNDVTRQEYISEVTYSFEADYGYSDKFDIQDAEALDKQTVEVFFTNIPDVDSASDTSMYYAKQRRGTEKVTPLRALYDPAVHPYKVTLFFNEGDLTAKREYEINVNYRFKDYLGNQLGTNKYDYFNASSEEKSSPSIVDATPISTDSVKLDFDKELSFNQNNLSPTNYTLEFNQNGMNVKKMPLGVLYVDAKTIVLRFDKIDYDIPYTLKFTSIMDYTGTSFRVTGEGRNYVEFMLEEE